jgi:hypothetical protein
MTRQQYKEKAIKDIRNWFKNHTAKIQVLNDDITVIDWNKGTFEFSMRIVLDRNKIYISGDLGEVVYILTEKATIESLANYYFDYFTEKLSCSRDKVNDFNDEIALRDLKEWLVDRKQCGYAETEEEKQKVKWAYEDLKNIVYQVMTCEEWKTRLHDNYIQGILEEVDDLSETALWTVGEVPNMRLLSYLEAFKMINEQMLKKAV